MPNLDFKVDNSFVLEELIKELLRRGGPEPDELCQDIVDALNCAVGIVQRLLNCDIDDACEYVSNCGDEYVQP